MFTRTSALLLAALLLPGAGAAAERPSPASSEEIDRLAGGEKLRALVGAVVTAQHSLRAMRARFVQVKESSLLLEPSRSSGVFSFRAPDAVRWDYESPDLMVVVFAEDVLTTYHPDRATAERVETSRRHRRFLRVLAGTQPLDELTTHFAITLSDPGAPAPYRLTLTTTNRLLMRRLAAIELEIDRRLLLPVVVDYQEADGDRTRFEFSDLELNPDLSDAVFQLELGEGVRVDTVRTTSGSEG